MAGSKYIIHDDEYCMEDLVLFAKKGLGLLDGKSATIASLARELGVDRGTIYRWMKDQFEPAYEDDVAKIEILATLWLEFSHMELKFSRMKDDVKAKLRKV